MPANQALTQHIQNQIQQNKIEADPRQLEAIDLLQEIALQLDFQSEQQMSKSMLTKKSFWQFSKKHNDSKHNSKHNKNLVKGIYIWGDVGRGKTWLMDQFYDAVDIEKKQRLHYHQFMLDVHKELSLLPSQTNPLTVVSEKMAEQYRLICLDEFHVLDMADAMILHGLLSGLFERGVTLITTSNRHPDDLFKQGAYRKRFMPAIALIKQNTTVFQLDNGKDYRIQHLQNNYQNDVFFMPHDNSVNESLLQLFNQFADKQNKLISENKSITLYGRDIPVVLVADKIIWFDFDTICRGTRSSSDYIQIAQQYKTVFISEIPLLHIGEEAPARRFLNLIDEFYDQHTFLILSSDVSLDKIYQGDLLVFEFQRALSRLQEMQSRRYWENYE